MTKLTIEIKGDKFVYDYEVGASKQHGDMPVCADGLALFVGVLKACSNHHHAEHQAFMDEVTAKCWIQKHPKEAEELMRVKP